MKAMLLLFLLCDVIESYLSLQRKLRVDVTASDSVQHASIHDIIASGVKTLVSLLKNHCQRSVMER